ncbi:SDR family NAD(P)-dependent oxidoreductase [Microtetraspora malaysiensis]|uniref:SDR family NAD(P)-dependent oxidoreductase n=1 Tax=Microtetraspora malaysiensis TaxID=161358 RepID=UPI003D8C7B89
MSEQVLPWRGRLSGRCFVVTGAASGIGRACAVEATRQGAAVTLADRDEARLTAIAAELEDSGADVLSVVTDITDESQCARMVTAACERFGRLDGAVLSAGIARHVPILEMSREQWEQMLAVHLTGAFLCLREVSRTMVQQDFGGSLVYVASSVAAGLGPLRQAHYVAAKAGALGLVRAAARELGPHAIRVNAVSPGFTRTELNTALFSDEDVRQRELNTPLGRVAESGDVADAVTFLLGDGSGFMTGQTLHVNGGTHMP